MRTWIAIGTDVSIDTITYSTSQKFGEVITVSIGSSSIEFTIEEYKPFGERVYNLPTVEQLREEAIEQEDGKYACSELEMKGGKVEGEVRIDEK